MATVVHVVFQGAPAREFTLLARNEIYRTAQFFRFPNACRGIANSANMAKSHKRDLNNFLHLKIVQHENDNRFNQIMVENNFNREERTKIRIILFLSSIVKTEPKFTSVKIYRKAFLLLFY